MCRDCFRNARIIETHAMSYVFDEIVVWVTQKHTHTCTYTSIICLWINDHSGWATSRSSREKNQSKSVCVWICQHKIYTNGGTHSIYEIHIHRCKYPHLPHTHTHINTRTHIWQLHHRLASSLSGAFQTRTRKIHIYITLIRSNIWGRSVRYTIYIYRARELLTQLTPVITRRLELLSTIN